MSNPNRLHVTWNAADASESLFEAGITPVPGKVLSPADIVWMLASKVNRMFALSVRSEAPPLSFALRLVAMPTPTTFRVRSIDDPPPYECIVEVASEPPPRLGPTHGDVLFELVPVAAMPSNSDQS